jgi:hypothetical protein
MSEVTTAELRAALAESRDLIMQRLDRFEACFMTHQEQTRALELRVAADRVRLEDLAKTLDGHETRLADTVTRGEVRRVYAAVVAIIGSLMGVLEWIGYKARS